MNQTPEQGEKTKEEILFPMHCHCSEELEMMWDQDSAKKAMDEWADQEKRKEAIAFYTWVDTEYDGEVQYGYEGLYDLYLQHLNQQSK
jgi:hypothetical protein